MDRWLIYHRWIIETQLGHQNFVTSASPAKNSMKSILPPSRNSKLVCHLSRRT